MGEPDVSGLGKMSANCTKEFQITIGDESLVAYWKFDEAFGATRADSTPNGNDISILLGSISAVAGKISLAMRLPATNVDPAGPAITVLGWLPAWNNTSLTVAGWLRQVSGFAGVNNETQYYWAANASAQWSIGLETINNDQFELFFRDSLNNLTVLPSGFILSPNIYYFIVLELDFEGLTAGISVDNNAMVTMPVANVGAAGVCSFNARNQSTVTQRDFDEFGVWYRKLTAAERTALYNSGAGNTYPNVPSGP